MTMKNQDPEFPTVKIISMWHGTHISTIEHICKEGFANLAMTDFGFFGKGIYGTFEAEYADEVYGHGKHGEKNGALLLCWFSTLNAFPVIDGDMSKFMVEDAETGRMVTTGNFKNFGSHFCTCETHC